MSARFVTVHRSYDPMQTEMLGELLRESDIAARVLGTRNAALVGVAPHIMQMHIEVPAAQAGAATDFLEAYFSSDGEELLRQEGVLEVEDAPDEAELAEADSAHAAAVPPGELLLRPLLAAGAVMLVFGFGHLYARRGFTAALLAGGQIWALFVIAHAASWPELASGATIFASLLLFDLIGSQLACRASNRGLRRAGPSQLAIGAVFVAVAVALGSLLGPRIPPPEPDAPADTLDRLQGRHGLLYD